MEGRQSDVKKGALAFNCKVELMSTVTNLSSIVSGIKGLIEPENISAVRSMQRKILDDMLGVCPLLNTVALITDSLEENCPANSSSAATVEMYDGEAVGQNVEEVGLYGIV